MKSILQVHFLLTFFIGLTFFVPLTSQHSYASDQSTINISGKEITLPEFPQFKEISGSHPELTNLFRQFVPETNSLLGLYVSNVDLENYGTPSQSGFNRYGMVQKYRAIQTITPIEFLEFKDLLKTQFEDIMKQAQPDIDKNLNQAEGYFERNFNQKMDIQMGQTKHLGAFHDSRDILGMISISNFGLQQNGQMQDHVIAYSTMLINVQDVPINLYLYSGYTGPQDLNWLREQSLQLATALADQ